MLFMGKENSIYYLFFFLLESRFDQEEKSKNRRNKREMAQAMGRGRGHGRGHHLAAAAVVVNAAQLPIRGLSQATPAMLLANPMLGMFHGLNVQGSYNATYATYTTFGNIGSTQADRMKTHFAETVVAEDVPRRLTCTIPVSEHPSGFGPPFKLCGDEIAPGDGGSNSARHVAAKHPEC